MAAKRMLALLTLTLMAAFGAAALAAPASATITHAAIAPP